MVGIYAKKIRIHIGQIFSCQPFDKHFVAVIQSRSGAVQEELLTRVISNLPNEPPHNLFTDAFSSILMDGWEFIFASSSSFVCTVNLQTDKE